MIFVLTCPNEKCEAAVVDDGAANECPACGTYLFPVRAAGESEQVRTRPKPSRGEWRRWCAGCDRVLVHALDYTKGCRPCKERRKYRAKKLRAA